MKNSDKKHEKTNENDKSEDQTFMMMQTFGD